MKCNYIVIVNNDDKNKKIIKIKKIYYCVQIFIIYLGEAKLFYCVQILIIYWGEGIF